MGIEVIGVEKRFGPVVAVRELSLHVHPGELLAIVGPSGCGKTTLLRVIAGLEHADAGRVVIGGRDATHLPPEKRNVGFVFQQFALFPNMNVAENIGYGLRRRRVPKPERERRVAELLAIIGMDGYDRRRPDQLSAGQQQRVALARALAPEPRTLLLDEPLSALDAAIRYQLRDELRRVQRRVGITTIMVTHDQEEALAIADRVAVMNEGRLEQIGTPWELYDQPRTQFVARFVGRGNFLQGEVVRGETAHGETVHGEMAHGERVHGETVHGGHLSHKISHGGQGPHGVSLPGLGVWPIAAPGDRGSVTVLVRPESIHVSVSEADPDEQEHAFVVPAIVRDIVFGGERAHVRLQLVGDGHRPHFGDAPPPHSPGAAAQGPSAVVGASEAARTQDTPLVLITAIPGGDVPRIAGRVGQQVTVTIPHDALRLLPD